MSQVSTHCQFYPGHQNYNLYIKSIPIPISQQKSEHCNSCVWFGPAQSTSWLMLVVVGDPTDKENLLPTRPSTAGFIFPARISSRTDEPRTISLHWGEQQPAVGYTFRVYIGISHIPFKGGGTQLDDTFFWKHATAHWLKIVFCKTVGVAKGYCFCAYGKCCLKICRLASRCAGSCCFHGVESISNQSIAAWVHFHSICGEEFKRQLVLHRVWCKLSLLLWLLIWALAASAAMAVCWCSDFLQMASIWRFELGKEVSLSWGLSVKEECWVVFR